MFAGDSYFYPQNAYSGQRQYPRVKKMPQYYVPAGNDDEDYAGQNSSYNPPAQYYAQPQRYPVQQRRVYSEPDEDEDSYVMDDADNYDALRYGYDPRMLSAGQRRQLERLAQQQKMQHLQDRQRLEAQQERQRQLLEHEQLMQQKQVLEQQERLRRQQLLQQQQGRARQHQRVTVPALADVDGHDDDNQAMDLDGLQQLVFNGQRRLATSGQRGQVDSRFVDPSALQKMREEQQRKTLQAQHRQQVRNVRDKRGRPQPPVAPAPSTRPALSPVNPAELARQRLRKGVVKIQAAVRAFLVRNQKLIPKLKEIASTRQKVQAAIEKNNGVMDAALVLTSFDRKQKMSVLAYEEEMIRSLISLDGLSVGGSEIVREARKLLVQEIQAVLSQLDKVKVHVKKLEEEYQKQQQEQEQEQQQQQRHNRNEFASSTPSPQTPQVELPYRSPSPSDLMDQVRIDDIQEPQQDPSPVADFDADCDGDIIVDRPTPLEAPSTTPVRDVPSLKQMCRSQIQFVMSAMASKGVTFDDVASGKASVQIVAV